MKTTTELTLQNGKLKFSIEDFESIKLGQNRDKEFQD